MRWGKWCTSGPISDPETLNQLEAKFEAFKASLRTMEPEDLRQIKEKLASWTGGAGGFRTPFEAAELAARILREVDQEIKKVLPEKDERLLNLAESLEESAQETEEWLEQRREEHPTGVPDMTPVLAKVYNSLFETLAL
jgi:chromosome segregation ATPase